MMAGKAVALRRRDALRHLLHPRQLTDSMRCRSNLPCETRCWPGRRHRVSN